MGTRIYFVICCRDCDDACGGEPTPIPFLTPEARGRWATEHKRGTGHDRWTVIDEPREEPEANVYSAGLCFSSACAPKTMTRDEIERQVNERHPTGISSRWAVSDEAFRDGSPNPSPCDGVEDRQHWLLSC